jgi:hypothetical protein
MSRYAKRKLKYSLNENFDNWSTSGMRVTLSYLTSGMPHISEE